MKYIFFLLFLGFQSSKCFKNVKKEKIISKKCPDVKCPPIDEPVCARVTSIKNNKTLYIIMVNKCEMEYMKCHQGLQASIVDMKNCGHEEYKTLKTLLRDKGRKRVKREAHSGKNIDPSRRRRRKRIARTDNKTIIEPEDSSGDIAVPLDATKEPITENGFKDISDSDEIANVKPEEPANPNEPSQEIETKNDLPEDLADDKILPDKEDLPKLNEVTDLPVPDMPVTDLPVPDMPVTNLPENMESGRVIVDAVIEPGKYNLENLPEELKKKKLTKDKKIIFTDKNQPDDYDIYQAECPMSCPTRDVMVCAKCQHNVYKTFMSICHMRMFSCMFTDEKLELVSRYPCVMSAPFLSVKPNTEPSGRITLADDEDKILKFIYCREKGNPTFMDGKNMILYSEKDNATILIVIQIGVLAADDKCNCNKTEKIKIILIKVDDKDLKLNSNVNVFDATDVDTNIKNITDVDKDIIKDIVGDNNNTNFSYVDSNNYNITEDCHDKDNLELDSLNSDEVTDNISLSNDAVNINLDGSENRRLSDDVNFVNTTRDNNKTLEELTKPENYIYNDASNISIPTMELTLEDFAIQNDNNNTRDIPAVVNMEQPLNTSDVETNRRISFDTSTEYIRDTGTFKFYNKDYINVKVNQSREPIEDLVRGSVEHFNNINETVSGSIDGNNQTNNKSDGKVENVNIATVRNDKLNNSNEQEFKLHIVTKNETKSKNSKKEKITAASYNTSIMSHNIDKGKTDNIIKIDETNNSSKDILSDLKAAEVNPTNMSKSTIDGSKKENKVIHKDISITDFLDTIINDESKPILQDIDKQNAKDLNLKEAINQHHINLDSIVNYLENKLRNYEESLKNDTKDERNKTKNTIQHKEIRGNINRILDLKQSNKILEQIDTLSQMNKDHMFDMSALNRTKEKNKNSAVKHQELSNLDANRSMSDNNDIKTHVNVDTTSNHTENIKIYKDNNVGDKNFPQKIESHNVLGTKRDDVDLVENLTKSVEIELDNISESNRGLSTTNIPYRKSYSPHMTFKNDALKAKITEPPVYKIGNSKQNNINKQEENDTENGQIIDSKVNKRIDSGNEENKIKLQDIKALFAITNAVDKIAEDIPIIEEDTNSTILNSKDRITTHTFSRLEANNLDMSPIKLEVDKSKTKDFERNILNTVNKNTVTNNAIYLKNPDNFGTSLYPNRKQTESSLIIAKSKPLNVQESNTNTNYLRHFYTPKLNNQPNTYFTNNVILSRMNPLNFLNLKPDKNFIEMDKNKKDLSRTLNSDASEIISPKQNIPEDTRYINLNIINNPRFIFLLARK
ncbi:GATA zinc finger domain-containing protein 14 isoform X2 [Manduca sexta]|uniref:GATA zinc finger domain-containing protein 14 isoform X2 n=1 Tax=Manduca sexta TaxID=7130 RepID=UPI001182132B|nr:GATA zinc finger domain-containing protein 14 isoform X2 [Manduca sexta]